MELIFSYLQVMGFRCSFVDSLSVAVEHVEENEHDYTPNYHPQQFGVSLASHIVGGAVRALEAGHYNAQKERRSLRCTDKARLSEKLGIKWNKAIYNGHAP